MTQEEELTEFDLALIENRCDRIAKEFHESYTQIHDLVRTTQRLIRAVRKLRGSLDELMEERAIDETRSH